jgi:hypothetical protein
VGFKNVQLDYGSLTAKEVLITAPASKSQKKPKSVSTTRHININTTHKKVSCSRESSSEADTSTDQAVTTVRNCEKHPVDADDQHCGAQKKAQCRNHPSAKPNTKKGKAVMKKCKTSALISVPIPVTRPKKLDEQQKLKSVKKICLKKYPVTRQMIVTQMRQQAVEGRRKKVLTRRKALSGDNDAGNVDTAGHVSTKSSHSLGNDNQPGCDAEHSEQNVTPTDLQVQGKSGKKSKEEENAVKKSEKKIVRRKPKIENVGNCGGAATAVEGTSGPRKEKTEALARRKECKVSGREEVTSNVKKKHKATVSEASTPSRRKLANKPAALKPTTQVSTTKVSKISPNPKVPKKSKEPKKKKISKVSVKDVTSTDQISDTVVQAGEEEEHKLRKDGDDSSTSDEITLDVLLRRQQQVKQENIRREDPSCDQRIQSQGTTVGPFPAVETDKHSGTQNIETKPSLLLIASVKVEENIADSAVASSPSTGNTSDEEDLKSIKNRIKVKLEDNSESERDKGAAKRKAITATSKSDESRTTSTKVEEITIKKESNEDAGKTGDKISEPDAKVTDESPGKERAKTFLGVKRSRAEGGSGSDTERRARRMKLFGFWSGPKRHRVASLNALAKVHCLYENESRGALVGICSATNPGSNPRAAKASLSTDNTTVSTRTLRSAPGLRGVGKHWDMHNASSSSSDDTDTNTESSSSSSSPCPAAYKPKRCQRKLPTGSCKKKPKPTKGVKKVVKRQRSGCELIMDLKDMVVRKRMASLNASAILAASYCVEKRAVKSVKDGVTLGTKNKSKKLVTNKVLEVDDASSSISSDIEIEECDLEGRGSTRSVIEVRTTPSGGQNSNKKVAVIVNQDTDVTITGVYVNSTTRSTHHEGFCSIAGMQYRISSTSHTQTEATAVATETLLHTSTAAEHVS